MIKKIYNINDSNSIIFRGIVTGVKVRAMKKMNRVKKSGKVRTAIAIFIFTNYKYLMNFENFYIQRHLQQFFTY